MGDRSATSWTSAVPLLQMALSAAAASGGGEKPESWLWETRRGGRTTGQKEASVLLFRLAALSET